MTLLVAGCPTKVILKSSWVVVQIAHPDTLTCSLSYTCFLATTLKHRAKIKELVKSREHVQEIEYSFEILFCEIKVVVYAQVLGEVCVHHVRWTAKQGKKYCIFNIYLIQIMLIKITFFQHLKQDITLKMTPNYQTIFLTTLLEKESDKAVLLERNKKEDNQNEGFFQ